jgi:hypothetical protein
MLQVSDLKGIVHIVQLVHTFPPNAFSWREFPPSLWTSWTT